MNEEQLRKVARKLMSMYRCMARFDASCQSTWAVFYHQIEGMKIMLDTLGINVEVLYTDGEVTGVTLDNFTYIEA